MTKLEGEDQGRRFMNQVMEDTGINNMHIAELKARVSDGDRRRETLIN